MKNITINYIMLIKNFLNNNIRNFGNLVPYKNYYLKLENKYKNKCKKEFEKKTEMNKNTTWNIKAIYKELKIDWKPETAGSLDDVKNNISIDDVQESILNCLKSTKKPRYRKLSKTTVVTANDFIHNHKETSGSD